MNNQRYIISFSIIIDSPNFTVQERPVTIYVNADNATDATNKFERALQAVIDNDAYHFPSVDATSQLHSNL